MRLMYGSPPAAAGKARESGAAIAAIIKAAGKNATKQTEEARPDQKFTWRQVVFKWAAGARFEAACGDWSATVWPDGLRWKSHIRIVGGSRDGFGETPQEALEDAVREWLEAVGKLLADEPEVEGK